MLHLSQRQASSAQGALLFIMSSGFGFSVISSGVFRFGLDGWGFLGGGGVVCLFGFCVCLFVGILFGLLFVFYNSVFLISCSLAFPAPLIPLEKLALSKQLMIRGKSYLSL